LKFLAGLITAVGIPLTPANASEPLLRDIFIHAGSLVDRPGSPAKGNSTLVIRSCKIIEVLEGFVTPPQDVELIDLKSRFVLPGLKRSRRQPWTRPPHWDWEIRLVNSYLADKQISLL
jgi:hypothetical protein